MQSISPHIYWTPDTCSVQLLRDGDSVLLIDCGTDLCPEKLTDSLGVSAKQLLLTHFHQDQCAGSGHWQARR